MITLESNEWAKLYCRLVLEYPRSYFMIREKCKRELGFTTRDHSEWRRTNKGRWVKEHIVYLDFYDDAKESWFRLKYL